MHSLSDYNYQLPSEHIAQQLASPAHDCKLMVIDKNTHQVEHHIFKDMTDMLKPHTHIRRNVSRVIKARLPFDEFAGELFFLNSYDEYSFEALVRPGKKRKVGATHTLHGVTFEVIEMTEQGRIIRCSEPILKVLEKHGQMPLPPYIEYTEQGANAYQSEKASQERAGSVAAPTASLHFTSEVLSRIDQRGDIYSYESVLHIGLGTFKQVDVEDITSYDIHAEYCEVDIADFDTIATLKNADQCILAVGTTVTRTLESLPYLRKEHSSQFREHVSEATRLYRDELTADISTSKHISTIVSTQHQRLHFETKLYIYPGSTYYIIDELITNFHLPKSSLLMLVGGLIGYDFMMACYEEAIKQGYMFYSFGDAMWIR